MFCPPNAVFASYSLGRDAAAAHPAQAASPPLRQLGDLSTEERSTAVRGAGRICLPGSVLLPCLATPQAAYAGCRDCGQLRV